MEERPRRRKIWIALLLALVLAFIVLAAGLYLLGSAGVSARYDDPRAVAASYVPESFEGGTLLPDGAASVRLTREDLYWFAQRYGLLDAAEEKVEAAGISRWGFRLGEDRAEVYLRVRILGFLPVSCRAEMSLGWDGGQLVFRAEAVRLGRYIPLPERLWPGPLRAPVRFPLGIYAQGVRDVRVEDGALTVDLDGLHSPPAGELVPEAGTLAAAQVLISEGEQPPGSALAFLRTRPEGGFPAGDAWTYALADDEPGETLAQVLALCTETSAAQVMESSAPIFRDALAPKLLDRSAQLRAGLETELQSAQSVYERALASLREMYKGGALRLGQSGFENAATGESVGPESLPELSATATDSRVIFLYSAGGGDQVSAEDMPPVSRLPRVGGTPLDQRLDPERAYDVGTVLTSEGGVPLLLHRRRDGTFVLREITEELYVGLLVERPVPVLDVDALPPPVREFPRPAGEGWTGAVLLRLS